VDRWFEAGGWNEDAGKWRGWQGAEIGM
jgi:hypothetical protein